MSLAWIGRVLSCAVLLFVAAGQAHAGVMFDGKTVGYTYLYPGQASLFYEQDVNVGAGAELTTLYPYSNDITLDISDTNIRIDYNAFVQWATAPFNGIRIFDKYDVLPAFGTVTVNGQTNMGGFSQSNVTFDENSIFINWQGLTAYADTVVSVDVTALDPVIGVPSAVPEPATLAIFGVGTLGMAIGAARRRKPEAV